MLIRLGIGWDITFASRCSLFNLVSLVIIIQVELAVEDIETILNTLIYDGKVEMTVSLRTGATSSGTPGQVKLYRAIQPLTQSAGLMKVPCGVCPVSLNKLFQILSTIVHM